LSENSEFTWIYYDLLLPPIRGNFMRENDDTALDSGLQDTQTKPNETSGFGSWMRRMPEFEQSF
jgi:hypothetical protein